ncbi:MAG: ribosome recycling factor [Oscillospiraceae bacterium]|nr:ribosome recycling factor [Oscillospiraceae bacterium]
MKEQLKIAKDKMQKTLDALSREFAAVRAGRANPEVLNKIQAEYWGVMTPITQMASVSVTEARTLLIQPYDASALKAIEKAIQTSDIGINPNNDGKTIRLVFPQLTEERRKELCKSIKKYGEEAKVSVRSVRRDIMDKFKTMKKNSEITEDDMKQGEKDLQKVVDKFCDEIDKMVAEKEKEVLSI